VEIMTRRCIGPGVDTTFTNAAPVKLTETWVRVPPVELDCSQRNTKSTASPRGEVGS
jgi:hypothetical protein